jgi:hypothetical protein
MWIDLICPISILQNIIEFLVNFQSYKMWV